MKQTRAIALCGVTAALAVVLMTVGGLLGIGLYAAPMLAGLCLLPAGRHLGLKYHLSLWLAVSALSFLLVPDVEQNLMFLCLFGCYPILRPALERLPRLTRLLCKLLFFNAVAIALEALVLLLLVPETLGAPMLLLLLALGNLTFVLYDRLIPRAQRFLETRLAAFLR
ncbi:MAG: hypothetical protein ACI4XW_10325 [Candidatus Spyradocola sp.]